MRRDVAQLIVDCMSRCLIPGLSIAVRHGPLMETAGFGFANLEHQVPATAETVYQMASVGKQFTAALIAWLAERGVIEIDREILPLFGPVAPSTAWRGITVRHLLTHTSGISDTAFDQLDLRLDYSENDLVRMIAATTPEFLPGTAWSYSNCGYILLGILISRVTGEFYGNLLLKNFFLPLQMSTARLISEADIVPNRAAGYRLEEGFIRNHEYVSPTLNRTADGSVCGSVLDLAKWDAALDNGAILSPSGRDAMWTPVELADGSRYPYGFGLSLATSPYGRVVEHDGEWQGFSSHFARYRDAGLTVMLLANLSDAPVTELVRSIAALYLEPVAPRTS